MTIFKKNSTSSARKKSVEVKFRIEEGNVLERKVSKKISEIKETLLTSSTSVDSKQTNILHENREFEPVDISINMCDLTL